MRMKLLRSADFTYAWFPIPLVCCVIRNYFRHGDTVLFLLVDVLTGAELLSVTECTIYSFAHELWFFKTTRDFVNATDAYHCAGVGFLIPNPVIGEMMAPNFGPILAQATTAMTGTLVQLHTWSEGGNYIHYRTAHNGECSPSSSSSC